MQKSACLRERGNMTRQEKIIEYIKGKYRPQGMIVYGSYADGTEGPGSDFDALVIADGAASGTGGAAAGSATFVPKHDGAAVDGTVLDVFVYPPEFFEGDYDPGDFVQVLGGRILLDEQGLAAKLTARVQAWLDSQPKKTAEELRQETDWCRKMLTRAERDDSEGLFRLHWLLTDSLEIFCDLVGEPWLGPKKALRIMAERYGVAELLYGRALRETSRESAKDWIDYLCALLDSRQF